MSLIAFDRSSLQYEGTPAVCSSFAIRTDGEPEEHARLKTLAANMTGSLLSNLFEDNEVMHPVEATRLLTGWDAPCDIVKGILAILPETEPLPTDPKERAPRMMSPDPSVLHAAFVPGMGQAMSPAQAKMDQREGHLGMRFKHAAIKITSTRVPYVGFVRNPETHPPHLVGQDVTDMDFYHTLKMEGAIQGLFDLAGNYERRAPKEPNNSITQDPLRAKRKPKLVFCRTGDPIMDSVTAAQILGCVIHTCMILAVAAYGKLLKLDIDPSLAPARAAINPKDKPITEYEVMLYAIRTHKNLSLATALCQRPTKQDPEGGSDYALAFKLSGSALYRVKEPKDEGEVFRCLQELLDRLMGSPDGDPVDFEAELEKLRASKKGRIMLLAGMARPAARQYVDMLLRSADAAHVVDSSDHISNIADLVRLNRTPAGMRGGDRIFYQFQVPDVTFSNRDTVPLHFFLNPSTAWSRQPFVCVSWVHKACLKAYREDSKGDMCATVIPHLVQGFQLYCNESMLADYFARKHSADTIADIRGAPMVALDEVLDQELARARADETLDDDAYMERLARINGLRSQAALLKTPPALCGGDGKWSLDDAERDIRQAIEASQAALCGADGSDDEEEGGDDDDDEEEEESSSGEEGKHSAKKAKVSVE